MGQGLEIEGIKTNVSELGKAYGVERIFLFGSFAKGEATDESDVDLRIDKGEIRGLFKLSGFQMKLEEKLGRKVDLLTTDSLDQIFLQKIAGEEILLYEDR